MDIHIKFSKTFTSPKKSHTRGDLCVLCIFISVEPFLDVASLSGSLSSSSSSPWSSPPVSSLSSPSSPLPSLLPPFSSPLLFLSVTLLIIRVIKGQSLALDAPIIQMWLPILDEPMKQTSNSKNQEESGLIPCGHIVIHIWKERQRERSSDSPKPIFQVLT